MPSSPTYVQYGSGTCAPAEWTNFDASPRVWFENSPIARALLPARHRVFPKNVHFGNIVAGLDIPPCSARGVYASHVLEHLSLDSLEPALRNTLKMLAPGGVFRLIVPSLQGRAERYVAAAAAGDETAADAFVHGTYLGRPKMPRGLVGRARELLGNSPHLWMYDVASMTRALTKGGFVKIRQCVFGDAKDPMFRLVENEGRFIDGSIVEVALEARAPGTLR